jgi:hypothetical protein
MKPERRVAPTEESTMNRFFAMMFLLVAVVFAWGCVGQPTTVDQDDETGAMDDDAEVSEPTPEPEFFPPKCAPDSCGYICFPSSPYKPCFCLNSTCDDW